jgi:chitinase
VGASRVSIQIREEGERRSSQWFAPYVDVTLPPYFNFQDPLANPNMDVVLSFVVASKSAPCEPSWGASYDLDAAASALDLDRRIVRHRQRGGDVIVSFGGVANDELAVSCTDADALADAYQSVVDRYHLRVIDLDLEGEGLDAEASARRATAIAEVQADAKAAGEDLDVWVTLPVAPNGLQTSSIEAVDGLLEAEVDLAGVNVMAMEFGASRTPEMDFVDASLAALDATATQLRSAYRRAGAAWPPRPAGEG